MPTTIPDSPPPSEPAAVRSFYRAFFSDPILQDFYGDSGYANLGFWDDATRDARAAGDRLVDELLALVPERRGTVLDVACGQGGSTRRLCETFKPSAITAIGTSGDQLAAARARAPGCTFLEMEPTRLELPDASFDLVLSIEAAFHFHTRERFLAEAFRVLRPGGWLAVSDLLMTRGTLLVPPENHLSRPADYVDLLEGCGFADVTLRDVTRETWHAFRRRFTAFVYERPARFASLLGMRDLLAANLACAWAIRASVLAAARKPAGPARR